MSTKVLMPRRGESCLRQNSEAHAVMTWASLPPIDLIYWAALPVVNSRETAAVKRRAVGGVGTLPERISL
jgi:hypothetical protein